MRRLVTRLSRALPLTLAVATGCGREAPARSPAEVEAALTAASAGQAEVWWLGQADFPRRVQGHFPAPASAQAPEAAARAVLASLAVPLRLDRPETTLRLVATRHGLRGTWLRFAQEEAGLPVFGGEVVVQVADPSSRGAARVVTDLTLAHQPSAFGVGPSKPQGPAQALARARAWAHGPTERLPPQAELGLWHGQAAYRVRLATARPAHDWELLVQAETGELLAVRDRLWHATGVGRCFDPNPVVTTGNIHLQDNNDADTPALTAARQTVELKHLDGTGNLRGTWVDAHNPSTRAFEPTLDYDYTRSDARFEEVEAYFQLDRVQDRLQQAYGFTDVNARVQEVEVNAQPDDNSFYSPGDLAIHYGSGGVDDAEDGDIIIHEYGHAIQDNQVPGYGGDDEGAMGEGFGDYLSGSMVAALAPGGDPYCVGEWDATAYSISNPPCLRRLDGTKHYPEFADGEVHDDGEMWSAALYALRDQLGASVVDPVVIESHFPLPNSATFEEAVTALLAADQSLFAGAHRADILRAMVAQGLTRQLGQPAPDEFVASATPVSVDNARQPNGTYANFLDDTQTVTLPGAQAIRVHFTKLDTEEASSCFGGGCDNLYLTDPAGVLYQVLHGAQTDFVSATVPGDTLRLRLVSDRGGVRFGYHVDRVEAMTSIPPPDAGPPDAGPVDAGPVDAGPADGGPSKLDAGPPDAGPVDAGPVDAGLPDSGPVDAGPMDAGPVVVDAGATPPAPVAHPGGCHCGAPGQPDLALLGLLLGLLRRRR